MSAEVHLPSILHIGANSVSRLPDVLRALDVSHPYIITDRNMVAIGLIERVQLLLASSKINSHVFCDVKPEPDDRSIASATNALTKGNFDCLIAVGGGSAIDSAKAIALLASHGGNMSDYKVPNVVTQHSMPVIAIPTTAGTGSECTKVTIISNSESSEKMLCMGPGLMPKAAIVDYELSLTAPARIVADTGIDALTHAIEAYVSQKSHLYSDQQAISAMKLIAGNLLAACGDELNRPAKEAMMLGACFAGIAFSNASVALVHGMSRPLGVHFHVPHGLSNAMLLPAVTEFSLAGNPSKYAQCAVHMGLVSLESLADETYCHRELIRFLNLLNQRLRVPSMSVFGISKQKYVSLIGLMTTQAIASGSPANNPLVPNDTQIKELYMSVYS